MLSLRSLACVVAGAFMVLVPGCGNSVNALSTTAAAAFDRDRAARRALADSTGAGGKFRSATPQCSDGIDNDGDGKIDYADPECVGAARQRRELVRDRHPGRQRRRLQAGLLLRRQLGHGRRRLHVAAQVRSDDHQRRVSLRSGLRHVARERVLGVVVAVADVHRQLPASWCRTAATASAAAPSPGAPTPIRLVPTCTAAGLQRSGEVPALHAGDPVHDPLRALRDLHRQDDAACRMRALTAARPTPAPAATMACGQYGIDPALCPHGHGLHHRLLPPPRSLTVTSSDHATHRRIEVT